MKTEKYTSRKPLASLMGGVWGWVFGLLLTSCTLSMEEWAVPEEEKGFEEAETVELEHGTYTYQFKEGVRSITENIQDYIIRVEELKDNCKNVYFMDNTPDNYLPKEGDLVASVCTPTIPFGLNHRVTSVKNIGGMYQLTCEPATKDDIYEDLEFTFEDDYEVPEVAVFDSLTLDSLGVDPDDLILEDYSLLQEHYGEQSMTRAGITSTLRWRETPGVQKLREAGLINENGTRADDKKDSDPEPVEDTRTKTLSFLLNKLNLDFTFATQDKKIVTVSIGGTVDKYEKEHVWFYENKKTNYRKQVTTSTNKTVWDVNIRIGKDHNFWKQEEISAQNLRQIGEMLKALPNKEKPVKKALSIAKIRVPIGASGFIFVINFEGNFQLTGGLNGHFKGTVHEAVTQSTYIYENGKETYIPDKDASDEEKEKKGVVKKGYTSLDECTIVGDAELKLSVRPAVGIETVGGIGFDIGFEAGVTVKAKVDIASCMPGKTVQMPNDPDGISFWLYGALSANVYFAPIGTKIFNLDVPIWEPRLLLGYLVLSPRVDKNNTKKDVVDYGDGKRLFTVRTCYDRIWAGIFPISSHMLIPRLRIYHGGYNGEIMQVKLKRGDFEYKLQTYNTYEFTFTDDELLSRESTYICVPCIYDEDEDKTYEFRESALIFGSGGAHIAFQEYKQRYGLSVRAFMNHWGDEAVWDQEMQDDMEDDFRNRYGLKKGEERNWDYYEFGVTYDVKNLTMYKKWGIRVKLEGFGSNKKVLYEKDIDLKFYNADSYDVTKRPGKKTAVFKFVTNYYTGNGKIKVYLTPYVIDDSNTRTDFPTVGPKELEDEIFYKKFSWREGFNDFDLK